MKYAKLIKNDIVDGEGICVSLWMQGCSHRCKGCHNPETWDKDGGIDVPYDLEEQIIEAISSHNIKRGFSVLGGEPLDIYNIDSVYHIVKKVRNEYPDIKIFIWTGYTYEMLNQKQKQIIELCDVLIDGRYIEQLRDIRLNFRGSTNQRVIDIQRTIKENKIILYGGERNGN